MANSNVDPHLAAAYPLLVRARAEDAPDRRAFTFLLDGADNEATMSFGEVDARARAIGAMLQARGLAGERVLLVYLPGLDFVAAFLGCLYAGVVAVPAYPPDPSRIARTLPRFSGIVRDSKPKAALTTAPLLQMSAPLRQMEPSLAGLEWLSSDGATDPDAFDPPAYDGADLAFLQYTSGSTGDPRGVMISHANLMHQSATIHRLGDHNADSVYVSWLPAYHDMGLLGGILQPLFGGFHSVLMSPLDFLRNPVSWLRAITKYGGTTSAFPNFALDLCVRKVTDEDKASLDLSTWNRAPNGGEPVNPESLRRFSDAFASCGFRHETHRPGFGLAEATLIVTGSMGPRSVRVDATPLRDGRVVTVDTGGRHLAACGETLPDQTIAIVDAESKVRCKADQVGEIWVKGGSVARGYFERPDVSEQTFGARTEDGDGPYMRTGDLGFLHDGQLYVTGRIKDLIIIRGVNHYPQDLERTAEAAHPAVRPGCTAAFSVDVDGEERAVVVAEVGRDPGDAPDAVMAAIRTSVTEVHDLGLHAVVLIKGGSGFKTSSGKVQRRATKDAFVAGDLAEIARSELAAHEVAPAAQLEDLRTLDPEARTERLIDELCDSLANALGLDDPDEIDSDTGFFELGLDSAAVAALTARLESAVGRSLPTSTLFNYPTVETLAEYLSALIETDIEKE